MSNPQKVFALFVVATLGLVACSTDKPAPQAQKDAGEAPEEQGAGGTEFPTGLFENENGSGLSFQFNDDGTFSVSGPVEVTGTYSIDGDQFREESNDNDDCKKLVPSPPYTWTYVGDNLTFELEGVDPCGGRWSALYGATYVRAASE